MWGGGPRRQPTPPHPPLPTDVDSAPARGVASRQPAWPYTKEPEMGGDGERPVSPEIPVTPQSRMCLSACRRRSRGHREGPGWQGPEGLSGAQGGHAALATRKAQGGRAEVPGLSRGLCLHFLRLLFASPPCQHVLSLRETLLPFPARASGLLLGWGPAGCTKAGFCGVGEG